MYIYRSYNLEFQNSFNQHALSKNMVSEYMEVYIITNHSSYSRMESHDSESITWYPYRKLQYLPISHAMCPMLDIKFNMLRDHFIKVNKLEIMKKLWIVKEVIISLHPDIYRHLLILVIENPWPLWITIPKIPFKYRNKNNCSQTSKAFLASFNIAGSYIISIPGELHFIQFF